MVKPCSASVSGETMAYNTVFIDTNLDTHLAMIVSDTETVSDLKKKILYEHPLCFPGIGEIRIHALKVKRRGHFYHLSDFMLVKSAFHGFSKSWFVAADASIPGVRLENQNQHPHKLDSGKQVICVDVRDNPSCSQVNLLPDGPPRRSSDVGDVSLALVEGKRHVEPKSYINQFGSGNSSKEVLKDSWLDIEHSTDNHCLVSFPGTQTRSDENDADDHCKVLNTSGPDLHEKYNDLGTSTGCEDGDYRSVISDVKGDSLLKGEPTPKLVVKRKRNSKKKIEDKLHDHALEEKKEVHSSGRDAHKSVITVPENSLGNVDKVISENDEKAHGKSLEEASPSGPPAKKKLKMEKKDGNEDYLTNKDLISDSIAKTSGLGAQQKVSNATIDRLSTDNLETNHLLTASPGTGKTKKKKKSSNNLNQVVTSISSSWKDVLGKSSGLPVEEIHKKDLGDAVVTPGQAGGSMVISEPCATSSKEKFPDPVHERKDVEKGNTDGGNVKSVKDTLKLTTPTASESHHATNVEGNADLMSQHIGVSGNESVEINDENRIQTDQNPEVEEERELSQNNVPKSIANLVGAAEQVKSLKKRKKSRKTQDPVEGTPIISGVEHVKGSVSGVSSMEPVKDAYCDSLSVNAEKEETDNVIRNVLESLQKKTENRDDSEKTGEKPRKKIKKKRGSTATNIHELQTEEDNIAHKDPILSTENTGQLDDSSKSSKMINLVKKSSINQSNETNSELKNKMRIENDPVHGHLISKSLESSQVVLHTVRGNHEEGPSHEIINGNPTKSGCIDEAKKHMKVSCESERVEVSSKFLPGQPEHDTVASNEMLIDKITDKKAAENEPKATKKKKVLGVHSGGPSYDSRNSLKSNENQGSGGKAQPASSSTTRQQRSLSKDESDHIIPHSSKKLSQFSEQGAKGLPSNRKNKLYSAPAEAQRPTVVSASVTRTHSEKSKEVCVASISSSQSSKGNQIYKDTNHQSHVDHSHASVKRASRRKDGEILDSFHVSFRKATGNNNEKVVNKLEQKKSLLAISGSIFKDDNNGNSEDDGGHSSDASTRTPSDVSSDYSDEDSDANFNSPKNGSYALHGKEDTGRNIRRSPISGPKNMSMEKILRSSSRYKKAKMTASQSQPQDDDSLPVECVPDSQTYQ